MKKKMIIIIGFFCVISIAFLCGRSTHLNHKEVDYNGSNLMVSVDGESVSKIPTSGNYYLASYDCKSKNTKVVWDKENYELYVSNGSKKAGVSCYLEFKTHPYLYEMPVGSYVAYVGNNGCIGSSCSGSNVGSCNGVDLKHSGFRIAYVRESAYLVSAGALECGSQDEITQKTLKYCNSKLVYDGVCSSNSVRGINGDDFSAIVNSGKDILTCYNNQDKKCGYTSDLLDIEGDYWYSSTYQEGISLYWSSLRRGIMDHLNSENLSIRPVIRMDNNVIVVGGMGTESDPYVIANNNFVVGKYKSDDKTVSLRMIGYQVKDMCININSTVCTNYVPFEEEYVLDVSKVEEDKNFIYVYYRDNEGKVIHTLNKEFSLKNV